MSITSALKKRPLCFERKVFLAKLKCALLLAGAQFEKEMQIQKTKPHEDFVHEAAV